MTLSADEHSRRPGPGPGPGAEGPDQTERADLLEALATQRRFLRHTVRGLTDEQAAQRTTVSELCLGGIIKHVTRVEERWARYILEGPSAMVFDEAALQAHLDTFRMVPGETLQELLDEYQRVADRTDELVRSIPRLDASQPLPKAPWFPPDGHRTARRVVLHVIAETAQHAGHADILREAIDGAKTMG